MAINRSYEYGQNAEKAPKCVFSMAQLQISDGKPVKIPLI